MFLWKKTSEAFYANLNLISLFSSLWTWHGMVTTSPPLDSIGFQNRWTPCRVYISKSMNLFKAKSQSGPVLTAVAGVFRKLNSVQNAIPLHDPKLKRNSHFYHQNNQNKEKRIMFLLTFSSRAQYDRHEWKNSKN